MSSVVSMPPLPGGGPERQGLLWAGGAHLWLSTWRRASWVTQVFFRESGLQQFRTTEGDGRREWTGGARQVDLEIQPKQIQKNRKPGSQGSGRWWEHMHGC